MTARPLNRPPAALAAWALWWLTVAILVAALVFALLNTSATVPDRAGSLTFLIVFSALTLVIVTVGALVASRRPGNPVGWVLVGGPVPMALSSLFEEYAVHALFIETGALPGGAVLASLSEWMFVPPLFLIPALLLLLFPDGRLPGRRWRPAGWLAVTGGALFAVGTALAPGHLSDTPFDRVTNPLGVEGAEAVLGALAAVGIIALAASVPLGAAAMIVRLRRSHGLERQQLKWLSAASGLFALSCVVGVAAFVAGNDVGPVLVVLTFPAIPIAAGYAILRHRLYDIDVVINRALVYGALTAILAGAYLGLVLLLGLALAPLTSQSDLAIALSTLAVAALFQPVRRRVQTLVDRRFYRRKYDAARTLERFGARLRSETDLDALRSALTGVVRETMQPAHVSLWLREGAR